jgi:hypothetical protein
LITGCITHRLEEYSMPISLAPPILSTESQEAYDCLLAGLRLSHKPWDYMSDEMVRMMRSALFEVYRYERHKALAVESKYRQRLEYQVERAKGVQARRIAAAKQASEDWTGFSPEFVRLIELLGVQERPIKGLDELFKRAVTELDHARALEQAIVYYGRLDECHNSAMKRFHLAFVMLQEYRQTCGVTDSMKTVDGVVENDPPTMAAPEATVVPENEAGKNDAAAESEAARADTQPSTGTGPSVPHGDSQ